MYETIKEWTYKGVRIVRRRPLGYYFAFISGHGNFKADTLQGMKNLINREIKKGASKK